MSERRIAPKAKLPKEKLLAEAVDLAREALLSVTAEENIGAHAGVLQEDVRVVSHAFICLLPGYSGWFWTVTLVRAAHKKEVTVNEVALLPGEEALLAPDWTPWADRLRPEDVDPEDRLPYNPDDSNLEPIESDLVELQESYGETGVDMDAAAQWELGLGRERVLSAKGRAAAFKRWYNSDAGANTKAVRDAGKSCSTCGYLMKMAGSARGVFGVCANEWSAFDGRVVSLDHGCGSHSETDIKKRTTLWQQSEPVLNEADLEILRYRE
ncbi:DUF3027 domain-containing protein [Arcanobacterium urinimassiliense]|uniref:DUF3027 domain-containing protein n=1 Tax=Arcanobacterium urinimassiliense TaxID=1871014 RepID=UPI000939C944|nr:DUF3027 domain-containing protein [Arcanobacterium urinimassiliense]